MPDPQTYHEPVLLQQLAAGDQDAFSFIFREYYSALCHFAEMIIGTADDAEDLVEEVFERLWHRHPSFDNAHHLKDFLYKSTRNACLDFMKRTTHRQERQSVFLTMREKEQPGSDLDMLRTEVFRTIYREIALLPEQCGKIVRMGYVDGLKNEEIARELGLSLQTVKNQKSRGITLLKTRLPRELFALLLFAMHR